MGNVEVPAPPDRHAHVCQQLASACEGPCEHPKSSIKRADARRTRARARDGLGCRGAPHDHLGTHRDPAATTRNEPRHARRVVRVHRLVAERAGDRGRLLPVRDHHRHAARVHDLQRAAVDPDPPRPHARSPTPAARSSNHPLWIRAIWFIFVGWWAGAIYMGIAWFLCVIIITLPVGLWLFNRIGAVMTLLRY